MVTYNGGGARKVINMKKTNKELMKCVSAFIRSNHLYKEWDEFRNSWFGEINSSPCERKADSNNEAQKKLLISFEQWKWDNDVKNLLPEQTVDFYLSEINND